MAEPTVAASPVRSTSHTEIHRAGLGTALRLIDPELTEPAEVERIVAASQTLRGAQVAGVCEVRDLGTVDSGMWLISAGPASPSLSELLESDAAMSKQGAASVLGDVGFAVLGLHGLGWTLLDLSADCIVIDAMGRSWLLDAPVHMVRSAAGQRAAAAFAELTDLVAAKWVPDGSFAVVSAAARSEGMSPALSRLVQVVAGQTATPDARLAVRAAMSPLAATVLPTPAPPTDEAAFDTAELPKITDLPDVTQLPEAAAVPPAEVTTQLPRVVDVIAEDPDATQMSEAATVLPEAATRLPEAETQAAVPTGAATMLREPPGKGVAAQPAATVLRFGPGVPAVLAAPAAVAIADAGRTKRKRHGFGTLVLLAIIGVLIWWLLRPMPSLHISSVTAAGPTQTLGCNSVADLHATLHTNGIAGTLHYHWIRSDGASSGPLVKRLVKGQHEAVLHLLWTVRGPGQFHGAATLLLDKPSGAGTTTSFSYSC